MHVQSRNQQGIGHVIIIVSIVVIGLIGLVGWRVMSKQTSSSKNAPTNSNQQTADTASSEQTPTEPDNLVLFNVGVELANIDYSPNAVREFASRGMKGFYNFGEKLGGKEDTRLNPNFEFSSLKKDAPVVSAITGRVVNIKEQPDSKDFEVFLQPVENSIWTVGYDHISDVAVTVGQTVTPGTALGVSTVQGNGQYRFEFQINKDENGQTTHVCPTTLLDSSVKDSIIAGLADMQNTWESTTGLELYDLTKQNPVGCVAETLTPAQAEGR